MLQRGVDSSPEGGDPDLVAGDALVCGTTVVPGPIRDAGRGLWVVDLPRRISDTSPDPRDVGRVRRGAGSRLLVIGRRTVVRRSAMVRAVVLRAVRDLLDRLWRELRDGGR